MYDIRILVIRVNSKTKTHSFRTHSIIIYVERVGIYKYFQKKLHKLIKTYQEYVVDKSPPLPFLFINATIIK